MTVSFQTLFAQPPALPVSALCGQKVRRRVIGGEAAFTLSDFVWDDEPRDSWRLGCHVLNLALTPRPQPAAASFDDGIWYPVGPLMFVPQGVEVRSSLGKGRQRSLTCLLSGEAIDAMLGRGCDWQGEDLARALNLRNPAIEQLMLRISLELEQPGFESDLLLDALRDALTIEIARAFRSHEAPPVAVRTGGLPPWRLRRIDERIRADAPAPRLSELSGLCGLSVRQLTRAFKAETGQTLASYIQAATMERARLLLIETDLPVARIATRLGFAGSASFCYAYRRHCGHRPSDLRMRRAPS